MHFGKLSFGSIKIGRVTYEHDVVIDRGERLLRSAVLLAISSLLLRGLR